MKTRSLLWVGAALLLATLLGQWQFTAAFAVPIEDEPDSDLYLALAHNVYARGVYTAERGAGAAPVRQHFLRLPGYPWMIAGVFALCGDGNQAAVRACQALLSALTACFVAALAYLWEPARSRRVRAALLAFLLAAVCPFTAIYGAIIQAETLTMFLGTLLLLAATWAFAAATGRAAFWRWLTAGLVAGAVQLVRPESGLFAAAVGFTIVGDGWLAPATPRNEVGRVGGTHRWLRVITNGAVFSAAFVATLIPWTLHNARVLHVYSPLPPVNAVAPGEMDYHGFRAWYRTWADSERYLQPFYWNMADGAPAACTELPARACDSPAEWAQIAALFDRYNAPADASSPPGAARAGLTRDLDAAFGELARARVARSPWRNRIVLPLRRALGLWFVPHAQYYDFEGSLFPLQLMDPDAGGKFWLPLFFGLTCLYTALGLAGTWRLAATREPDRARARRWVVLVVLVIGLRWAYLATLENTEPRYMVEVFPLLCVLGGLALAAIPLGRKRRHAERLTA